VEKERGKKKREKKGVKKRGEKEKPERETTGEKERRIWLSIKEGKEGDKRVGKYKSGGQFL